MIYAHHDTIGNVMNVLNTKDMKITREMIVSEVAKVIVGKPYEVINALNRCNISVSPDAKTEELVLVVNHNMARSRCLRNDITTLIVNNQGVAPRESRENRQAGYFNTEGGSGSSSGDWGQAVGQLLQIGYGVWASGKEQKDSVAQREHEMMLANMNADLMLKQMEYQNQRPDVTQAGVGGGSSMFLYILLGVGVLAAVGFAVYQSKKD
jgi:hypothetical protein